MKAQFIQRIIISTTLFTGLLTVAHAAIPLPVGWYVEPNVGISTIQSKSYKGSTNSGIGYNLNAGYKFMPYFAAEIGYTHYYTTKVKSGGTTAGKDAHYSYDLAAKAMVPITDSGAEVFAKLGIMRLNDKVTISNSAVASSINLNAGTHTATGIYMALGGDYAFTPEMAGVVQWARAKGNSNTGTMDLLSIGLTVLFE